ncbi:MAG: hypothetical protein KF886_25835 [Candidatus Hydrogenedentes bacterium]|nr:hypothetical protein [Candidatus Hydrogenedentota bacterium]
MEKSRAHRCLVVAVILLGVITLSGCGPIRQAYSCNGVQSSNSAMPLEVSPIVIEFTNRLPKDPMEVDPQLQRRKSIQARINDLSVSPLNLAGDAYYFEVHLRFDNVGEAVYAVPVDEIRLEIPIDGGGDVRAEAPEGANEEILPAYLSAMRKRVEPAFEAFKGEFAVSKSEESSITLFAHDETIINVDFRSPPFETGTLVFSLRNETTLEKTTLSFDIQHFLTYRGAIY